MVLESGGKSLSKTLTFLFQIPSFDKRSGENGENIDEVAESCLKKKILDPGSRSGLFDRLRRLGIAIIVLDLLGS